MKQQIVTNHLRNVPFYSVLIVGMYISDQRDENFEVQSNAVKSSVSQYWQESARL
jgi:hypothetical protein